MYLQPFQGKIVTIIVQRKVKVMLVMAKFDYEPMLLVSQKLAGIIDLQDLRGCWKNGRRLQHAKANVYYKCMKPKKNWTR